MILKSATDEYFAPNWVSKIMKKILSIYIFLNDLDGIYDALKGTYRTVQNFDKNKNNYA